MVIDYFTIPHDYVSVLNNTVGVLRKEASRLKVDNTKFDIWRPHDSCREASISIISMLLNEELNKLVTEIAEWIYLERLVGP